MSYLQITLQVAPENRAAAGAVYTKYRDPFLTTVDGATDKQLLMRDEDVPNSSEPTSPPVISTSSSSPRSTRRSQEPNASLLQPNDYTMLPRTRTSPLRRSSS